MRSTILPVWTTAILAGLLLACGGGPPEPPAPQPAGDERITVADIGLATPESVLHDPIADVYLVSNINGGPLDTDANGFISRLSPDGRVLELRWIDGADEEVALDAPKGMALVGDVLYVADITVVRRFDRTSGAPLGDVPIAGATFVNDLAPAADGGVWVSDSGISFGEQGATDTGSAAVHHLAADGTVSTVASGAELLRPNGLVDTPDRGLIMVPFGGATVFAVASDGSLSKVAALPGGGLDGVVRTTDGRLLVSSWEAASVFAVDSQGLVSAVLEGLPSPADIGYDAGRNRVLIPLFNDATVVIAPLPQARHEE